MTQASTDKLRSEFKADIKELKADFSSDLNSAVARIEASIKAHSESSAARQSELVARIQSHDDRQTASFLSIMDWKILVETRLSAQAQSNKVSAAVFGAVGAALLSLIVRLMACNPDLPPIPPIPPVPPATSSSDFSKSSPRRN